MLSGLVSYSCPDKGDARLMWNSWEMTQGKMQVKICFPIQLNFNRAIPEPQNSSYESLLKM